MREYEQYVQVSTGNRQHNPHESLAQIVLECLSDPNTIESKETLLRHATQLIFLNASANPGAIPAVALVEGLFSLSTFPPISTIAAECLVVLSLTTPSTWKLVSSSAVFERHCNASSILNMFIRRRKASSNFNSIHEQLLATLHQLSDIDFWERRSFLICLPHTPFYFALRTALSDLSQSFSELPQEKEVQTAVVSDSISAPNAFIRLQTLVEISFKSDWEGVPENLLTRTVQTLRMKISDPLRLEQFLAKLPSHLKIQHLTTEPSLLSGERPTGIPVPESVHDVGSSHVPSRAADSDDGCANDKANVDKAILNILCTVPTLADCLNYHPSFSIDESDSELLRLVQKCPEAMLSKLNHVTSAVITILTGLPNAALVYDPMSLSALHTLLQAIAILVRNIGIDDEVLVIEGLKFLVDENRLVNGVPTLFTPVALPLFAIITATPVIWKRKEVEYLIRSIANGRTTCEKIKLAAQTAIRSHEEFLISTSKDGKEHY